MQPTNTVVERPTSDDVLFGRHAQSWNHEGNRRFRSIVSKYQDAYHSAKVRIKKVAIVAKIVNEVRQNGARFLRRDKQLSKWYEVDRKACIEKVGHAIRDKQAIAHRSLHGRQAQYLKKKSVEEATLTKKEKLGAPDATKPEESKCVATTKPDHHTSSSTQSSSQEDLPLPKQLAAAPDVASKPLVEALKQELLMQHVSSAASARAAIHPPSLDLAAASAMIRHNRDVEAATRKLVAAEELYSSLRKQQALEGELALLRQRSALLSTISQPTAALPFLRRTGSDEVSSGLALLAQLNSLSVAAPHSVGSGSTEPVTSAASIQKNLARHNLADLRLRLGL